MIPRVEETKANIRWLIASLNRQTKASQTYHQRTGGRRAPQWLGNTTMRVFVDGVRTLGREEGRLEVLEDFVGLLEEDR